MAGEALLGGVLRGAVSNLSSPLLNEFWLLWGLEADKKKLESYLSSMEAVLRDAERRHVKEERVKVWLKKLKDAAYDADDLVDEFVIEARRRKALNKAGMREKVGYLFYPPVFRFKMAHKMQKLRERFDYIAKEKNDLHFAMGVVDNHRPPISITRETDSCVPECKVYGRDDEKEKLVDSLINSGNEDVPSILPIVGMGGLGKTTMAQLVFNDERVVAHFDPRRWVYVSEDFDLKRLLKEISQHNSSTDQSSIELLQTHLRKELSGKKYLLILDDVWNGGAQGEFVEKWRRLKTWLASGSVGSKILVTTRNTEVADAMGTLPTHSLGKLSENDSWTLFEKLANPNPNFVSIGKEIVGKCDGLPLAVKTLGGLMSSKKTEREWESVKNSEFWTAEYNDGIILPTLRLSYDHLTSSLKQCFAYCAIFAKGDFIDKDKIVKQWIALGFIHSDEENELLEEKGEDYFNHLIQRSLFEVGINLFSNKPTYEMHDLVHDLLRFVVGTKCLIVESSTKSAMKIDPSETCHLSLQDYEWASDPKNLQVLKKCKKLHSLFPRDFVGINDLCSSWGRLRVLDLSGMWNLHLPNSIEKLKHLRYLDVSDTGIRELPETICNLHSLQTLILLGNYELTKLPKNMKRMISLRHIEFDLRPHYYHDDNYFPSPNGIGKLTCLRTLPKFVVRKESGHGIEELKGLNLLWGDLRIEGLDNIRSCVCACEAKLKDKQHLRSLHLSWSRVETVDDREGNPEKVIDKLEPQSNLKELVVENYMGLNFPSWMTMLTNLVDVQLSNCNRCEHLPPLGHLPFLVSLEIKEMSAVKYIVELDGSHNYEDIFPSLKRIVLSKMPNLKGMSSGQEDVNGDNERERERDEGVILRRLTHLVINKCPNLIRLPQLYLSPNLESLEIEDLRCEKLVLSMCKSLEEVSLKNMPNLERCLSQEADDGEDDHVIFPSIHTLKIFNCPKLTYLPWILPPAVEDLQMKSAGCDRKVLPIPQSRKEVSLTQEEADDSDQLVKFPRLELHTGECPRRVSLPHPLPSHKLSIVYISAADEMLLRSVANCTSLVELYISRLPEVTHLPNEFGVNHAELHTLEVRDCPKLMSLSNQLENLHALKTLDIEGCGDLVLSLSDGLQQQQQRLPLISSLEKLKIYNSCDNQNSFPGDAGILFSSLEKLGIDSCKNLESLSFHGLQNLADLQISDCPKLGSLDLFENLKSLKKLLIFNCPNMTALPESMGDLTLLRILWIFECPKITTLPEGLQRLTNLEWLSISDCPILERELRRKHKGQEWNKVKHVPRIVINCKTVDRSHRKSVQDFCCNQ